MGKAKQIPWLVWRFDGRESGPLTLFPGDLVMHLRPNLWGGKPEVLDVWEMAEYGELFITSRFTEFPARISREDPSSGQMPTLRQMLTGFSGAAPANPDPANVWRVRAGDRVALIGERPGLAEKMIYCLADFMHSALVYWRYDEDDLPDPMEAMMATVVSGDQLKLEWGKRAVEKVIKMGAPHAFSEEWSL